METMLGVQVTLWQLKLARENDNMAYAYVFQKLLLRQLLTLKMTRISYFSYPNVMTRRVEASTTV